MEKGELCYTVVNHRARKELGISIIEYMAADSIHVLSHNPKSKGWCDSSQQYLADFLDVRRETVNRAIFILKLKGIVEEGKKRIGKTAQLRTTQKWFDSAIMRKEPVTNSHRTCDKFSHYKDIYKDNKQQQEEDIAADLLDAFKQTYKTKLPVPSIYLEKSEKERIVRHMLDFPPAKRAKIKSPGGYYITLCNDIDSLPPEREKAWNEF